MQKYAVPYTRQQECSISLSSAVIQLAYEAHERNVPDIAVRFIRMEYDLPYEEAIQVFRNINEDKYTPFNGEDE